LLLTAACRPVEREASALRIEHDTIGHTVVVRTLSGSIWATEGRLEEELRIGTTTGPEEYAFGDVTELAPDTSGGVYVFDRQAPAIRHYDREGHYLGTLGREGGGPGEYRAITGMAVTHSGRLVAHDPRNGRVSFYAPDGGLDKQWPVTSGLFVRQSLTTDSLDNVYVKAATIPQPGDPPPPPPRIGLIHFDSNGRLLDTIYAPHIAGEPKPTGAPLGIETVWAFRPACGIVVGVNRTYSFEIHRPDGSVTQVMRDYEPIEVRRDEWEAYEARRRWEIAHEGPTQEYADPTPRSKPVYRSLHFGQDCRVWVQKYTMAARRQAEDATRPGGAPEIPFEEPIGFDVFEPDGDYLGEVVVPAHTTIHWFGSDQLYGIRRGASDEQYVVRLRLRRTQ
jgi:hypothetical protein